MGQTVNTNAAFLSQELNELGINVLFHITVGDNPHRLDKMLNNALENSDMIITTGGLGPTQDDLTKEIIAKALGRKLHLHRPTYGKLESFFKRLNREMTNNNIKQAYLPDNSIILENNAGTAPGFIIEEREKVIISLPGPPKEMKSIYFDSVKPYLQRKSEYTIKSKLLKFVGIGESSLENVLVDLISNQTNPTLATYAKDGELTLRITAKGNSHEEIDSLINPIVKEVESRLKEYIYSYRGEVLEEVVVNMLLSKNLTLSLAESCTGGLLSSKLTSVSGVSKVFDRGIVTYSNTSKSEELGVRESTLRTYGAVSKETAMEMALGIKRASGTDISLSITGVAGPTGGSPEKPVGLIYIGIATDSSSYVKKLNLTGDRNKIRNYTTIAALNLIRKTIQEEY